MRTYLILILICGFCILQTLTHAYAVSVVDDTGRIVILHQPAQRVISLAPDLTEDIFALGKENILIGVDAQSNYPEAALKIERVASYDHVNAEAILNLHPDLIIGWADAAYIKQLKGLPIPLFLSHPKKIMDVASIITRLGELTGANGQAQTQAQQFLIQYNYLKHRYQQKNKVTVFYQLWSKPLMTVSAKSWISDAIFVCGGENLFKGLITLAPIINKESVLQANPQVIIGSNQDPYWPGYWKGWRTMQAVQNSRLYTINADIIERAGPRLLQGVEELCKAVHEDF